MSGMLKATAQLNKSILLIQKQANNNNNEAVKQHSAIIETVDSVDVDSKYWFAVTRSTIHSSLNDC